MLTFKPVPFAKESNVFLTCSTRSRVGKTIRARRRQTTRDDKAYVKAHVKIRIVKRDDLICSFYLDNRYDVA
jgi:hypothetical protein